MGGCWGGTADAPAGDTCGGRVGGPCCETDVGGLLEDTVATVAVDEEDDVDEDVEEEMELDAEEETDALGAGRLATVGRAVPGWHVMTGGCCCAWACCCAACCCCCCCKRCCWAEESESLSLSRGLGMLGDELRLSWSMSLGSPLLASSFTLRPSELSPSHSDGESGRFNSCTDVWGTRQR